jgi:two-component SAPR family response regulator
LSIVQIRKDKEEEVAPNLSILLITPDQERFAGLSSAMTSEGGTIQWSPGGAQALETLDGQSADLVVADDDLGDMTGLTFIERLVKRNPMLNCALVSALPPDEYHEASEGLGILMQLPSPPADGDGRRLMNHLRQILGLAAAT